MSSIKLLILDVDGTLTDGQIYIAPSGEMCKVFDVKDGYGIKHLLKEKKIRSAIITGRSSEIVAVRAKELGIDYIYQGIENKVDMVYALQKECNLKREEIAFMGDDLNDLPAMQIVGVAACPADAVQAVKEKCVYICGNNGGHGAVREFIDWIVIKEHCDS